MVVIHLRKIFTFCWGNLFCRMWHNMAVTWSECLFAALNGDD